MIDALAVVVSNLFLERSVRYWRFARLAIPDNGFRPSIPSIHHRQVPSERNKPARYVIKTALNKSHTHTHLPIKPSYMFNGFINNTSGGGQVQPLLGKYDFEVCELM